MVNTNKKAILIKVIYVFWENIIFLNFSVKLLVVNVKEQIGLRGIYKE